ncbi:MAG TPA: rRNA maturation RNase YbeY, partial [Pseudomonas sp.]|nr:rRNA maturation RNase YbeY [Pseudomonas sp.]
EAEEMEELERQLLAELGHPDPYAEESPVMGTCKDS